MEENRRFLIYIYIYTRIEWRSWWKNRVERYDPTATCRKNFANWVAAEHTRHRLHTSFASLCVRARRPFPSPSAAYLAVSLPPTLVLFALHRSLSLSLSLFVSLTRENSPRPRCRAVTTRETGTQILAPIQMDAVFIRSMLSNRPPTKFTKSNEIIDIV